MKNIKGYRDLLLENFDQGEQSELEEDLIHAVRMNRIFDVKKLLDKGADPNCLRDRDTPLSWAAQNSHVEIMAVLLDAGADPDIEVMRWGRPVSVLCMAMSLGERESIYAMMELLLDAGVNPNGRDTSGRTPLAILAHANDGNWDRYDLLFKYGADPNIPDYDGHVPLDWPFKYMTGDDRDIAKILILNGADPAKAKEGAKRMLALFGGDLDWIPDGATKEKVGRVKRTQSLFRR